LFLCDSDSLPLLKFVYALFSLIWRINSLSLSFSASNCDTTPRVVTRASVSLCSAKSQLSRTRQRRRVVDDYWARLSTTVFASSNHASDWLISHKDSYIPQYSYPTGWTQQCWHSTSQFDASSFRTRGLLSTDVLGLLVHVWLTLFVRFSSASD